jgi:hypothetical protein
MVALPSPVVVAAQLTCPHPSIAVPAVTVYVTVTPPAAVISAPSARTVNAIGTPTGTVLVGAVTSVSASPVAAS